MPLLSIAENIFLGNEQRQMRRHRLGRQRDAHQRAAARRSASTRIPTTLITNIGVGKQQLVEIAKALSQGGQAADPRRADGEPVREGQPGAARPAARVQAAGHHLDPDLAQAQRGQPGRRPRHRPPRRRRPSRRSTSAGHQRGPHHHLDGRPLAGRPLPAARRRRSARSIFEVKNWIGLSPAPRRPAGDQGHRPQRPQGRGRRHRRADGRRAAPSSR